jgi:hypothetical protein
VHGNDEVGIERHQVVSRALDAFPGCPAQVETADHRVHFFQVTLGCRNAAIVGQPLPPDTHLAIIGPPGRAAGNVVAAGTMPLGNRTPDNPDTDGAMGFDGRAPARIAGTCAAAPAPRDAPTESPPGEFNT